MNKQIYVRITFKSSQSITHHLLNNHLNYNISPDPTMFQKTKQFLAEHKYKFLAGTTFALAAYAFAKYYNDDTRIRLSAFLEALHTDQLDEVVVQGDTIHFKSALSEWYHSSLGTYPVSMLFQDLKKSANLKFACENQNQLAQVLIALGLALGSAAIMTRIMMPQKFGTINKFPKIVKNHQTFDNFYGSEELKLKLKQVISFLKDSHKFKKLGGRIRKGILLYGPPGTGKTMLAKTLANEANLPFIQTCAAEFQQIYVGVGPKKIRDIFQRAKSCPEGCIVFIDQLDAIGSRSEGMRFSRETTATINQLLTELDGFEQNTNIVVIGATNRIELVDSAIIRAGRFDLKIRLQTPNKEDRLGILKTLIEKKHVPNEISGTAMSQVADQADGWCGADIDTLINESIFKAIRANCESIQDVHILQAFQEMRAK